MSKAGGPSLLAKLSEFDAYAKTLEDFSVRTKTGATVTIVSSVIILWLLVAEFISYQTIELKPQLSVDPDRNRRMDISLNLTLPKIPCYLVGLHVMDASGEEQMDTSHTIYKTRVDRFGQRVGEAQHEKDLSDGATHGATQIKGMIKAQDPNYCGSCYGGTASEEENFCCNTCDSVQKAYLRKGWVIQDLEQIEQCVQEGVAQNLKDQDTEGCNIQGSLNIQRISGNFHFALGRTFISSQAHIHDLTPYLTRDFDFSHTIHKLAFGEATVGSTGNPLDNVEHNAPKENAYFQYFIKVVGTRAVYLDGSTKSSNQYAVTFHEQQVGTEGASLPGLYFNFDISPMLITYTETKKPFTSFLTSICAIIGGVFTVASILDSLLYHTQRSLQRKMELGKLS